MFIPTRETLFRPCELPPLEHALETVAEARRVVADLATIGIPAGETTVLALDIAVEDLEAKIRDRRQIIEGRRT